MTMTRYNKRKFAYEGLCTPRRGCLAGLAYGFCQLAKAKAATPQFEVKRPEASGYSNDVMDVPFCGYFDSNFAVAADGEGHCLGVPGAIWAFFGHNTSCAKPFL